MFIIEDINKEIAHKLKIDIKLVTAVNTEQWKQVEYNIRHHTAYEIKVLGLCTFTPRYVVVKKKIRDLIIAIRRERSREPTERSKMIVINLTKLLSNIWKIKNKFALNNIKIQNKKLNRQDEK